MKAEIFQDVANLPTIMVIFGATGDLTNRKLIPALYNLDRQGLLPDTFQIIAFARKNLTTKEFCEYSKSQISKYKVAQIEDVTWKRFTRRINYLHGDFKEDQAYSHLAKELNKIDSDLGVCTHKIFYLAISPDLYERVFQGIGHTRLNQICQNLKDTRVVIEKPFGRNLDSFLKLNAQVSSVFAEEQIYRIDHFLGKETVQNILYFKAGNPVFMSDWSESRIDTIDIVMHETLGVEDRAAYYDSYGQLRDMIQSHMLQLAALILAEIPESMDASTISKNKEEVLNSIYIENIKRDVHRAQYSEGVVEGKLVNAYAEEKGVKTNSITETYVRIKAKVKGGKWHGLKINLETGKRMPEKKTEIRLHYKSAEPTKGLVGKNCLIFRLQPSEGISLEMQVKKPNNAKLETVTMNFDYDRSFREILPDAYEKILLDVIRMSKNLFPSAAELEASWKFTDMIVDEWRNDNIEIAKYPAGTLVIN
ncbi:MAG: glucose-6-phosphate dehydrogenase [Candidatus Dojkabacteria bacterium]|uniref:Glucose-6-phosphate 1-dehydrogenase n=1 Tax=Candidatus Dojkabacteria bacterium TaxID=2099670 RepID=A0A952DUT6_9BACT|nr:glucose-6-phosphate dehydrogenase [Candidatus Dojkabacteria bacterium]WKZ27808.1 MAG: glucose-6-phosphate dehydrogenase [Candidatus Dojkabacteria bacterium]